MDDVGVPGGDGGGPPAGGVCIPKRALGDARRERGVTAVADGVCAGAAPPLPPDDPPLDRNRLAAEDAAAAAARPAGLTPPPCPLKISEIENSDSAETVGGRDRTSAATRLVLETLDIERV